MSRCVWNVKKKKKTKETRRGIIKKKDNMLWFLLKRLHCVQLAVVVVVVIGHSFVGSARAQQVNVEPIQRREDVLQKVAEGKTNARAISRVTSPQEAWEQIQLRNVDELKLMMQELINDGILSDIDDDDLNDDSTDEDSIRSLAYDEDVIELWFKKHPEDITKYKPKPKPKKSPPRMKQESSSSTESSKSTPKNNANSSSLFSVIMDQFNHVRNMIRSLFIKDSSNGSEF